MNFVADDGEPMKLFVDDLRPCPDGWELARTNTAAIRKLAGGYVQEISLDHDIVFKRNKRAPLESETFEAIAWYLAIMPYKPKIKFHSANEIGVLKMKKIIGLK